MATIALLTEAAAISASAHTAELAALLAAHRGTLVVSGLPNCWGSCDRFIGRALLALDDLTGAQDHLASAEALEKSAGMPVHAARTRLDQARLALALGDRSRAGGLVAGVREVARDLGLDALDREAAGVLPPAGPLSRREEEVLAHLSAGAANKEIAAALYISLNTVERHLANIYTKLGVRGDLPRARRQVRRGLAPGRRPRHAPPARPAAPARHHAPGRPAQRPPLPPEVPQHGLDGRDQPRPPAHARRS